MEIKEKIQLPENYNIITLCGSTRFKEEFEYINRILTINLKIVLQPGVYDVNNQLNNSIFINT
jgi:hypothetical protein